MTAPATGPRSGCVPVAGLVDEVARLYGAVVVACPAELAVRGDRATLVALLGAMCGRGPDGEAGPIRIAVQVHGSAVAVHVEHVGNGSPGGIGAWSAAAVRSPGGATVRCVRLPRGLRFTIELTALHGRVATA